MGYTKKPGMTGDPALGGSYNANVSEGTNYTNLAAEYAALAASNSRLSIGTVTTVSSTTPADASITGDPGAQLLNLSIPQGAVSANGIPTGGTVGQILSKNSSTNYDTSWADNYATDIRILVKNTTGAILTKGTAVYISSADGININVSKAQANTEATSSKTMGLIYNDIAANATGYVVEEGTVTGIDTSTATVGDAVWLSPSTAGGLIFGLANKPVAPNHLVYLGVVSRSNANNGVIQVKVQNGFELDELHNVLITSVANNDTLQYESSTSLWKNKQLPNTDTASTVTGTQLVSSIATGTSPLSVASTTVVPNLNVSQLTGNTWVIPGTIGSTTPNTGAFTTLSASSTVSGAGFSAYLASPPTIGGTVAGAGSFSTLSASGNFTLSGGTANGISYLNASKVITSGTALTFDGTNFATTGTVTGTRLISNIATGTAPLAVTSTTVVPNLNVALLNGTTWTAPGAIGSTTASTGAFTTLTASSTSTATAFVPSSATVPTNGLYLPAANSVGISTGTTQSFVVDSTGTLYTEQPAPTALTATSTLTIANLQTEIITVTSSTAVTLTLPTGTLTDAGIMAGVLANNMAFEWIVVNLGSTSGAITMATGTAHTFVGNATVAISTSAKFRTRKTAANTYVTYRIA